MFKTSNLKVLVVVSPNFLLTTTTSWISKFRTFITYSIGYECLKLRNFNFCFLVEQRPKAIPYHTRILTETGTKINFRFRYRRKWTLTRRKSPTDLKPLECRFPDGNEIHSRRLHQSNGNLFEHVKFYILPTFYTLIGWTLIKMRLNFNW